MLKETVEILREVDAGKASRHWAVKKLVIPKSTLSAYIRNRKAIKESYKVEASVSGRKRQFSQVPRFGRGHYDVD